MKKVITMLATCAILTAISLTPLIQGVAHAEDLEGEGNQLYEKIENSFLKAAYKSRIKLQNAVNKAIDETFEFLDKLTEY